MATTDDLNQKLEDLGKKIEQKKLELNQKGIFTKEHQITQAELDARYKKLKAELDEEASLLEDAGHHVGALEKAIINWINAIDLDSK